MPNELFKVGDTLANGATVVSDNFTTTNAQGATQETIIDDAGNQFVISAVAAGSDQANAAVIASNVTDNLAIVEAFVAANPAGAPLDTPTTAALLALVSGSARIATNDVSSTAATTVPNGVKPLPPNPAPLPPAV